VAQAPTEHRVESHGTWQEVTFPPFAAGATISLHSPVHTLLDFSYFQSRWWSDAL